MSGVSNGGELRFGDAVCQNLRGSGVHLENEFFGVGGAVAPEAEAVALNQRGDFVGVQLVGVGVFRLQRPEHVFGNPQHVFDRHV